jgi:hypothetical protein
MLNTWTLNLQVSYLWHMPQFDQLEEKHMPQFDQLEVRCKKYGFFYNW